MRFRRLVAPIAILLAVTTAPALMAQTVIYDNSSPINATNMTGYLTQFNQLAGMEVSWTFAGGGGGSGIWGDLGGGKYGVSGTDFSLKATGGAQTYFSLWSLHGVGLSGFSLNPTTAGAIFDVTMPSPGTPGSSLGHEFDYCSINFFGICFGGGDNWNTSVTYANPVRVDGNPAVGDLWGTLDVAFGNTFGESKTCYSFFRSSYECGTYDAKFVQDADMAEYVDKPGLPADVVPEPASMSLLAMGLAGLAASRKRRRRA